ncbi:MAG: hypothetical protein JWN75_38 [Candidatus Saccharibacteria bacterium]|nr:hypothetical protein [Candidatus Saccharibacteria bacterium]
MIDTVKRKDFVKRSVDVFHSYAQQEVYKERIKKIFLGLGYSTEILDMLLNPETYTHIPFTNGQVAELPFDTTSHGIGVVAIKPGEEISLAIDSHPLQYTDYHNVSPVTSLPVGVGASVFNTIDTRRGPNRVIREYGRPTLFLPYKDGDTHVYPTVLAHEKFHIAQQISRPFRSYSKNEQGSLDEMIEDYNNEFEAYAGQEDIFGVGIDCEFLMDPTTSMACTVDSYRKNILAASNGKVTRETLEALRRDYVGCIVRRAHITE